MRIRSRKKSEFRSHERNHLFDQLAGQINGFGSSDDCIDQDRMNSIDRGVALQVDCKQLRFPRQFDQMAQDLKTIMHVQIEHKATKRKRGAEWPDLEPKRRAPFTPPSKAPKVVVTENM